MEVSEILSKVDHTLLRVDATTAEVEEICKDAIRFHTASVCIPPSFVAYVAEFFHQYEQSEDGLKMPKVCTVIGFPNGYATTAVKCFEAKDAVTHGADEIDMVIPVGLVKEGRFDDILQEINQVKKACDGKLLKVIIETCLLTPEEIIDMCKVVSTSDADYIKTSTGFSTRGATIEDVCLMKEHIMGPTKIKAAGGIGSLSDAEAMIMVGADRLGTSKVVAEVKRQMK